MSEIPIISAVGHEIDFTISDFVADLRAPTPTGAAEMAVPNMEDVKSYLSQINIRLTKAMNNKIEMCKEILNRYKKSYVLTNPMSLYNRLEQNFDHLYERLINAIKNNVNVNNERLNKLKSSYIFTNPNMLFIDKAYNYNDLIKRLRNSTVKLLDNKTNKYVNLLSKLEVLNPVTTLKRGYSITKKDNKSLTSIKDLEINDTIITNLSDGYIESTITKIEQEVLENESKC